MSKLCPQCQRQRSRRTNASRKTATSRRKRQTQSSRSRRRDKRATTREDFVDTLEETGLLEFMELRGGDHRPEAFFESSSGLMIITFNPESERVEVVSAVVKTRDGRNVYFYPSNTIGGLEIVREVANNLKAIGEFANQTLL